METNKKTIHTNCSCGNSVEMKWNGSWHSVNCKCGKNIRQKGGSLIIDTIFKPKNYEK